MINRVFDALSIRELRQKFILTLVLLAVYRMGFLIPLPFVDQQSLAEQLQRQGQGGVADVMQIVALFSASDIGNATVFGLGIMPYISASIVFQLLAQVYPPLEQLQKEGDSGRRKINEYTRYATVILCLIQSYVYLAAYGTGGGRGLFLEAYATWYWAVMGTVVMTAGTCALMWIGEQIDAYGIGNGVSLLIMAGIVSRVPYGASTMFEGALKNGVKIGTDTGMELYLALACVLVGVIAAVVAISQAQRKIPVQSAKFARSMGGGSRTTQTLPLKLNQAGVMPIIFASSLLMFPMFAFQQLAEYSDWWLFGALRESFGGGRGLLYTSCFVGLIFFFSYFWTALSFNPKQIAESLRDHGSFVLGYRPGKRTEEFLEKVVTRVTFGGALFLSLVAVLPNLVTSVLGVNAIVAGFYGGTGLLIVVSVVLDLFQKVDGYLAARNYDGFLESPDHSN